MQILAPLTVSLSEQRIGMESDVFQEQMSACLNCRACEAVCPSGVQYGQILEASRTQLEQARDEGRLAPHPWPVRLLRTGVFDARTMMSSMTEYTTRDLCLKKGGSHRQVM